jgi:hypothetical protein
MFPVRYELNLYILSRVLVTIDGFGLVIRFIKHSQIVTTRNYSVMANSYTAVHYNTY